uniref:Uncharacterized protein n=1 Tax=Opuntia streptacantha TaxID=393608 RepID=A0A7C8ZRA1_OPUST
MLPGESLGFHRKEGSMDELKEERKLKEFMGSQGTRKRGLKVMYSLPCICAQPFKSTNDLKKSMLVMHIVHRINNRKFPIKMHGWPCTFARPCISTQHNMQGQLCICPDCAN